MSLFVPKKTYVVEWMKFSKDFDFYQSKVVGCDLVEARSPAKAWKKVLKLHDSCTISLAKIEEVNPCEKAQRR